MLKTAVVYFTRTNNTKYVAEQIANSLDSDLIQLIDKKNRSGAWGWIMAGRDALRKQQTDIEDINFTANDYDLIFIGIPNWAGQIPPAMRAFIAKYDLKNKKIILFCTQNSSGAEKVFAALGDILEQSEIINQKFFNKPLQNQAQVKEDLNSWLIKFQ